MTARRRAWVAVIRAVAVVFALFVAFATIVDPVVGPRNSDTLRYTKEVAAQTSIRAVPQAQAQYRSQCGRFAASLAELGSPASGAGLIGSDVAAGEKNGYKFSMTGNAGGYQITAVPVTFGATGSRTFYSDQTTVIREGDGPEPAIVNSKDVDAK
ncbi:MAG TPA: hypothetical protein VKF41_08700 [Bryobacteraceae bacterium]|nr:hypothetical protein [Bryobacteraceae bacterium]